MKITIVGRQMDVPKGFHELAEKKLSKYDKFFKDDASAHITMRKRKNLEILEVTISSAGMMFRGEEEASTFQNALDEVMNSIERQLRKNKTKLGKRIREGVFPKESTETEPLEDVVPAAIHDAPVRIKEFVFKPMSTEEAILQMNMLGHQFFVFLNEDTEKMNVVYLRKDEKYGLIVPKE